MGVVTMLAACYPQKATVQMHQAGSCCEGIRWLGGFLTQLCECDAETTPEEEGGHLLFQKLQEEKVKEEAEAAAKAAAIAAATERARKEWEAEMAALAERRAHMGEEELEQDCLAHFATFEHLFQPAVVRRKSGSPRRSKHRSGYSPSKGPSHRSLSDLALEPDALENNGEEDHQSETWEWRLGPEGPAGGALEAWLEERLGERPERLHLDQNECVSGSCSPLSQCKGHTLDSFGELPLSHDVELVTSLAEVLKASAYEAETEEADMARQADNVCGLDSTSRGAAGNLSDDEALDADLAKLLAKFSEDTDDRTTEEAVAEPLACVYEERPEDTLRREVLRVHAEKCRAIAARVEALAPCTATDSFSARLVVALAALDIGGLWPPPSAPLPGLRETNWPLLCNMSTADACWALCSEKKRLIIEQMLPGVYAEGRWTWAELRQTAIGWWLAAPGDEQQLEALVTKLAQSSMVRLRKIASPESPRHKAMRNGTGPEEDPLEAEEEAARQAAAKRHALDEGVFWSVLLGAGVPKLKALLRTGVLKEHTTGSGGSLEALLQHPKSSDPEFLRKNAFRLLQLHRYHLAAAVFLLSGSFAEAAQVVATRMEDLQLMLLVTRKNKACARRLLEEHVIDGHHKSGDPWLSFLLSWHLGDHESCRRRANACSAAALAQQEQNLPNAVMSLTFNGVEAEAEPLFDGVLRLCTRNGELEHIANALLGREKGKSGAESP